MKAIFGDPTRDIAELCKVAMALKRGGADYTSEIYAALGIAAPARIATIED
ncbi:hypothetical protein [Xanthomonas graminis]|jgi:hypothetical protein|uniref:Uncharacterized protein n=1 Tax=Xanthomonas graminis pv. graminis TaxID=134874 RepID=A0A1M4JJ21_9XANT|nr:hypothetical protein [Xanthomonas translucens]EKU25090.1 hypothetical protein XTG29_01965 [Xanthomonas translucens pv. graminis ART-Xtg29]UKE52900.1 hypothetical protein KFS84_10600 [Xanthomonas translucens pv. graminis]WIH10213.1 hypothetical protein KM579_09830 [Xanthomonas translucens pv. graminis]WIH13613.1 hypothetical protein KM563_08240 [Xanthomonas translucens pv. graminis]WIH14709.1 hypothetical protein KM433_11885 [Xanthomonas translucens pv. graminis]